MPKYDYISFMEKMTLDENEEAEKLEAMKVNGHARSGSSLMGGGRRVSGNLA